MIRRWRMMGLTVLSLMGSGVAWAEAISEPAGVATAPTASHQWRTVFATRKAVQLAWPANAQSARLTVSDGKKSVVYALSAGTESFDGWYDALPMTARDEKSLSFAVDYYTGAVVGDAVTGTPIAAASQSVAGVGLVRGTDNSAFDARLMATTSSDWAKVALRQAVVPTPSDATQLTVGETVRILDGVPAWQTLSFTQTGTYGVTLTGESGTIQSVNLTYSRPGLAIFIQ